MNLDHSSLFCAQGYINGAWVDANNGASLKVRNPADGALLGTVPRMGREETRRAIEAAHAAFLSWRAHTAKERGALLRKWFTLIEEHREELAVLITTEQGKPLAESRVEVAYAGSYIEWFAEEAKRVYGETIASDQRDQRIVVTKAPVGVVGRSLPGISQLPCWHAKSQRRWQPAVQSWPSPRARPPIPHSPWRSLTMRRASLQGC